MRHISFGLTMIAIIGWLIGTAACIILAVTATTGLGAAVWAVVMFVNLFIGFAGLSYVIDRDLAHL